MNYDSLSSSFTHSTTDKQEANFTQGETESLN